MLEHPEADGGDAAETEQRPEMLEPDSRLSAADAGIQLLEADAATATARLGAASVRCEPTRLYGGWSTR